MNHPTAGFGLIRKPLPYKQLSGQQMQTLRLQTYIAQKKHLVDEYQYLYSLIARSGQNGMDQKLMRKMKSDLEIFRKNIQQLDEKIMELLPKPRKRKKL